MVFSSLELQRRLAQIKAYYKIFYPVWKETSVAKCVYHVFPKCVYHGYNLLRWMSFIPAITGRHSFLYKFNVTLRFGATAMLLRSLKQVFWKKSAFYIHYLHNNITMLLIPKAQNQASTSQMFLTKFISWKWFLLFQLVNVPHFSL